MQKIIKAIFPSITAAIATLILPFILTTYFLVTSYSQRFIIEADYSYSQVQNNLLGRVFFEQKWIDWINRFMDFAIWGLVAIVIILAWWLFANAKLSLKNHYTEESFVNFKTSKSAWHRRYFSVVVIRLLFIVLALYCLLELLIRAVPHLAVSLAYIQDNFNGDSLWSVVSVELLIILLQLVVITCIKLQKHIQSE